MRAERPNALVQLRESTRHPIHHHPSRRHELRQQIKIPHIARQHARPELARLQEDQRVVDEAALVAFASGQAAQAEHQAGQDAGMPPGGGVGGMKPVGRDVRDGFADHLPHMLRRGVLRVQTAEGVRQLGQAGRGVMAEPIGQQAVDFGGRAALQDIQIDGRVEEQRAADRRRRASARSNPKV